MTTTAERNRTIKAALAKTFGRNVVRVAGGRGTAYGWVHVNIKTPGRATPPQLTELRSQVEAIVKATGVKLSTYYPDDGSSDAHNCLLIQFDAPEAPIDALLYNCCADHRAPDWSKFDALEIGGCIDLRDEHGQPTGNIEGGIAANEAEFFTVYAHLKSGGVEAITDCPSLLAAQLAASVLTTISGLAVS